MEEKVQVLRSTNGRYKMMGDVKNSVDNGVAKEIICIAHGHELREGRGLLEGMGIPGGGEKRGEN